MKRTAAVLTLFVVAACGESPSEPAAAPMPEPTLARAAVPGTATWYFDGTVSSVTPGEAVVSVGDPIQGSVTFTLGDAYFENDCVAGYWVDAVWTYTHDAVLYTFGPEDAPAGYSYHNNAIASTSCSLNDFPVPYFELLSFTRKDGVNILGDDIGFFIPNPDDTKDFPLTPPPMSEWIEGPQRLLWVGHYAEAGDHDVKTGGFVVDPLAVYSLPQSKDDCMKDGWLRFGFRNQGQCIRMYNTGGKDSH